MSAGRRSFSATAGSRRQAASETTLACGVDAGIGAPGDRQLARVDLEGPGQLAGDRAKARLGRPAVEVGAVVRDGQPVCGHDGTRGYGWWSTSSRYAIGAASPGRGPSFTMRV